MTDKIFEYDIDFYVACPYTGRTMILEVLSENHDIMSPDGGENRFKIHIPNTASADIYQVVTRHVKFYPGNNIIITYLDSDIVFDKFICTCTNPETGSNPSSTTQKPVINFSANPTVALSSQSITFTDESLNEPTLWHWDFGDGNTSTEQHPVHRYTNNGIYTVRLDAWNAVGSGYPMIKDMFIMITDTPLCPVARFTPSTTNAEAPVTITFTNNTVHAESYTPTYTWDFGDGGTSESSNPSHEFTHPGTYGVKLTAKNGEFSATSMVALTITGTATTMDLRQDKTYGNAPLNVTFTNPNGSSPYAQSSVLDYGDGTNTTVSGLIDTVGHVYTKIGKFTPRLTVTDRYGIVYTQNGTEITVSKPNLTLNVTAISASGTVPFVAQFAVTQAVYNPTQFQIDFGDGKGGGLFAPSTTTTQHLYTTAGTYTANFYMWDCEGVMQQKQIAITASAAVVGTPVAPPVTPAAPTVTGTGFKYHVQLDNVPIWGINSNLVSTFNTCYRIGYGGTTVTKTTTNSKTVLAFPSGYFQNYQAHLFKDMIIVLTTNNLNLALEYTTNVTPDNYIFLGIKPPSMQPYMNNATLHIYFGKNEQSNYWIPNLTTTRNLEGYSSVTIGGFWTE